MIYTVITGTWVSKKSRIHPLLSWHSRACILSHPCKSQTAPHFNPEPRTSSVIMQPPLGPAQEVVPGDVMETVAQGTNGAEWQASLYLVSHLLWPLPVPGNVDKQMAHPLVSEQRKLTFWAWLWECWDTGIPKQCRKLKKLCKPGPKCVSNRSDLMRKLVQFEILWNKGVNNTLTFNSFSIKLSPHYPWFCFPWF